METSTRRRGIVLGLVACMISIGYPAGRRPGAIGRPTPEASEQASTSPAPGQIRIPFRRGQLADYGASPWYTDSVQLGISPVKLAFDTGSNFIWATSDLCETGACNAHDKLSTTQPGWSWLSRDPKVWSFGPWGSMKTGTGTSRLPGADRTGAERSSPPRCSRRPTTTGAEFKTLAWDGGIGFPSNSSDLAPGSGFYFRSVWNAGGLAAPKFSVSAISGEEATFILGGTDVALIAKTSGSLLFCRQNLKPVFHICGAVN